MSENAKRLDELGHVELGMVLKHYSVAAVLDAMLDNALNTAAQVGGDPEHEEERKLWERLAEDLSLAAAKADQIFDRGM